MVNRRILCAAGLAAGVMLAASSSAEQFWQVRSGVTSIQLFEGLVEGLGLQIRDVNQTASPTELMEDPLGFEVSDSSDLVFVVEGGILRRWLSGSLRHEGGFTLVSEKGVHSFQDFVLYYENVGNGTDLFIRSSEKGAPRAFDLSTAVVNFSRGDVRLMIGSADMLISRELASAMGRPDLEHQIIGTVSVFGQIVQVGGDEGDSGLSGPEIDGGIGDIQLFRLQSLSAVSRTGAFPNGANGLSMSTTACNVGTANVAWFAPMNEQHPVIAMNLYREKDGRFEQIGYSWLKHGFFSTNSGGCGSCQHPGSGNWLGPNCSDTYGVGNNSSRTWLGPREEVNPFTGRWTCRGSHFSGGVDDCTRRHSGGGHGSLDHLLLVQDQDLNMAGAQFFYEAYYIAQDETDKYNNIGSREATASWSGSQWTFGSVGGLIEGPAVERWGDISATAEPRDEGDAILSAKTTDLGGGMFHYEYALYVHTQWQEIRSFSVPLAPGVTAQNIGFHDVDQDAGNDWSVTIGGGFITWSTDTFAANPDANSLAYGRLYNFRFDADAPPQNSTVVLGTFKPGPLTNLTVGTLGPPGAIVPDSFTIIRGLVLSGGLPDLFDSDDSRLVVRTAVFAPSIEPPVQIEVVGTSPTESPSELRFRFEGMASRNLIERRISLYNYVTQSYEELHVGFAATSDEVIEIVVTANASRFVEPGTRQVKSLMTWKAAAFSFFTGWNVGIDQTIWRITP